MLKVQDLGWMAGILDLKARFVKKQNKDRSARTQQVVMYVESVQTGVVRKLATLTGTKVELTEHHTDKDGFWRRGCETHCDVAHVHVVTADFKPTMRWTITGVSMATVLHNLAPYMLTDVSEFIDLGLRNTALRGRGSGAALGALRRLTGLGWQLPPGIILPENVRETLTNEEVDEILASMGLVEEDDDDLPELPGTDPRELSGPDLV